MQRMLALSCLFLAMNLNVAHADSPSGDGRKAVLATGASTGIGRKITERLAAHGILVYAGARKDSDLQALGASATFARSGWM